MNGLFCRVCFVFITLPPQKQSPKFPRSQGIFSLPFSAAHLLRNSEFYHAHLLDLNQTKEVCGGVGGTFHLKKFALSFRKKWGQIMLSCPGQASFLLPCQKHHLQLPPSPKALWVQQASKDRGGRGTRVPSSGWADVGLERVMLKGHECAESPCWSPRSPCDVPRGGGHTPSVYCLLPAPSRRVTFASREKDPHLYPCIAGGSARAPTHRDTFQLGISHADTELPTRGGQRYRLLGSWCSPVTKGTGTWAAGDMDGQAAGSGGERRSARAGGACLMAGCYGGVW